MLPSNATFFEMQSLKYLTNCKVSYVRLRWNSAIPYLFIYAKGQNFNQFTIQNTHMCTYKKFALSNSNTFAEGLN